MMRGFIILSVLFLSAFSANAEYWFDDFDSYEIGRITDQEGWSANTIGVEVAARGDSLPNALSLPYSPSSGVYGRYNDLDVSCGSKILRVSFRLYRDNTGQEVRVELRDLITTRLEITTDTSDGTIVVSGTDSGVAFITGQYATLTLFYNGSNNEIALTLNGAQILGWQNIGLTAFSSIDNIRFYRIGPVTGDVLFDDVSVQTMPTDVQAWWRFEEGINPYAYEETGQFKPDTYIANTGGGWTSATPAVYSLFNGDEAVRNRKARINTSINTLDQSKNIDLGNNWTVEFIASFSGVNNCTLFEWRNLYPPASTTGAWIKVDWISGAQQIGVTLRDDNAAAGEYVYFNMGNVPRDGSWHHIAITKQATALQGYVDYQNANSRTLGSTTDGSYSYDANGYAYIGQDSAGGDKAQGGICFDEIRISDNVNVLNFLRIDHPRFTQMEVNPASTALTFFGTPWSLSTIQHRTDMLSGTWALSGSFLTPTNYLGEERSVNVTKPSSDQGFYKIQ